MATAYLRAESAPVILPHNFAQAAAVMAQFDRAAIGSAIEVLMNLLDVLDGNPDDEPGGDDEPLRANGDSADVAWIEWDQMRGSQKPGPNVIQGEEDHEDDDPAEEDDASGQCDEDGVNTAIGLTLDATGPGCAISDTGIGDTGGFYN